MNNPHSDPFPAVITTRGEFGTALQWLRHRHAVKNSRPELSLRDIAGRIRGCVHNTVRNYLAGSTLPSPQALHQLLILFEATEEQRTSLVRARQDLAAKRALAAVSSATGSRTVAVSTLTGPAGCAGGGALLFLGTKSQGGE